MALHIPPVRVHVELLVERPAATDPRKTHLRKRIATVNVQPRLERR